MEDKIVKEVREVRRKIEAEFDNDPQKYIEHLYEAQKKQGGKIVRGYPKPAKKRHVA